MSKFTKKSLAVLTTAAIMASTASITAFAGSSDVTFSGDNFTATRGNGEITDTESLDNKTEVVYTITADAGYVIVSVSGVDDNGASVGTWDAEAGTFTVTPTNDMTITVTTAVDNGNGGTPAEAVVWVNGKDVKDDKKTKDVNEEKLYKTYKFDQTMVSAGGKWAVAVTPDTVNTVDAFLKEFDSKGKLKNASEYKKYASAKIKEGTVTVTAGKEAKSINVWVYEVKSKVIVASQAAKVFDADNPYLNAFKDEDGKAVVVEPKSKKVDVKVAPTMAITTTETKITDGVVKAFTPAKLAKSYEPGDTVTVYFGDKKNDTSADATFVLWDSKNKKELGTDGVYTEAGAYTATLVAADEETGVGAHVDIAIAATADKSTKITVQVKNEQSGKIAKIAPKVVPPTPAKEVTVKVDPTVTVKNGTTEVKDKEKVAKDTTLTIAKSETAGENDVFLVNGVAIEGTTYKVTGLEANAEVEIKAGPAPAAAGDGEEEEE